ncbi:MAG: uncharacterized protein K0R31_1979 [Clostridiales bacterium]|nr:uncharacterized protein [Clostridiales bacterium]
MGKILGSYIFPHPPIMIPEIGKGEEVKISSTLISAKNASMDIQSQRPSTIIITTPHGPAFSDFIYVPVDNKLKGNLGKFGAAGIKQEFVVNTDLANKIIHEARLQGITAGDIEEPILKKYRNTKELDHGVTVPMYFIMKEYSDFKLVYISVAFLPFEDLYRFGMCIQKAVEDSLEQVVFVASGDLSHRLTKDAPYGFSNKGKEFDDLLVKSLKEIDIETLLGMDEGFCESAGECGLRSFLMMFGALDGYRLTSEVYSYEGPFGVGYSIAKFSNDEKNGSSGQILNRMRKAGAIKLEELRTNEDAYVQLARKSLETYIKEDRVLEVPGNLPGEMASDKAGTFVSIKKSGQLRGCIGTIEPVRGSIADEIIHNAISSGTGDPRFDPVEEEDLDQLVYSVDVLGKAEPINSLDELDVIRYGVIVRTGKRSGLLLPNLEGVDNAEQQVSIALQKAGIRSGEKYTMERFEVIRHK